MRAVQVGRLLHSLNIDPRSLPGRPDAAAWDSIFQEGASRFRPPLAADVAANAQLGHAAGPANGCVITHPSVLIDSPDGHAENVSD